MRYCSLDIETTGFDPLTCEILEVGFVIFEVVGNRLEITEEWTQVFKPNGEVPAQIFALTGIGPEELVNAPAFAEHQAFLQDKLGNATIVGHNVIFDIKFLQAFGIKFSGEVIDTLELVQFILPTHHSYNLENLMHTFGVSHQNAHRALADSKACLQVLEKLLLVYAGFPDELKEQFVKLIKAHNFSWKGLFANFSSSADTKTTIAAELKSEKTSKPKSLARGLDLQKSAIYNLPLGEDLAEQAANILEGSKEKVLLVVPRVQQVMGLWKNHGWVPIFSPEVLFNERKFNSLLKKKDLSPDLVKFLLKVLVWKYTNWQTETILELNLSFFGGQFKDLVSGGKLAERTGVKLACCDQATFLSLAKAGLYKKSFAVILGLNEFENAISGNISTKISWGYIGYLLRSIYNPELLTGNAKLKEDVEAALLATDLFFGLVSALLQTDPPSFQNVAVTDQSEYSQEIQKIRQAAENFISKLSDYNSRIKSAELEGSLENLKVFFQSQPNRVRWIELAENRCVFCNNPLDISDLVSGVLGNFKAASFIDSLGTPKLLKYFIQRLGLEKFSIEHWAPAAVAQPQRDLFSIIKNKISPRVIKCYCLPRALLPNEMADILTTGSLPVAVLFGSALQVRQFYDEYYERLKSKASVLAQTSSGGGNKILRNFSINQKSILLATDKFILKQSANSNSFDPVQQLKVKTLILCHLPFEQFKHPYQEALSARFENPFEDYSLPKAVYNFHSVLKFFNTEGLENIYICEPKVSKSYWSAFNDYLDQVPRLKAAPIGDLVKKTG